MFQPQSVRCVMTRQCRWSLRECRCGLQLFKSQTKPTGPCCPQDDALDDAELNAFQVRCFNAPLQPEELMGVKKVVQDKMPQVRLPYTHPAPCVVAPHLVLRCGLWEARRRPASVEHCCRAMARVCTVGLLSAACIAACWQHAQHLCAPCRASTPRG